MEDCSICLTKFTKFYRQLIPCSFCNIQVCSQCWRTYFLSLVVDPKCLECDKSFSLEFLHKNFTVSFINHKLIKSKCGWILKHYTSQIPNLYSDISRWENDAKRYLVCLHCLKLVTKIKNINYDYIDDSDISKPVILPKLYCSCNEELKEIPFWHLEVIYPKYLSLIPKSFEKDSTPIIVCCPQPNCNGFINIKYTDNHCNICNTTICKKCQCKTTCEDSLETDNHVCKQEDIETVENIKKTTRRCPKCHVPIHKIHGCTQMWCTMCHTAFDYKSGKIFSDESRFHNPHYMEYIQNGGVRLTTGEEPRMCGLNARDFAKRPWALKLFENSRHVQDVVVPHLNELIITPEKIAKKTYNYLQKKCLKRHWENFVINSVKKNMLYTKRIEICNLYCQSANSLLLNNANEKEIITFSDVIRKFHYDEMHKLASSSKLSTLGISFYDGDQKLGAI